MDPIDETLRRAADAANLYRVPEKMIQVAATSLTRMPDNGRRDLEVAALVDAILHIAAAHQPCEVRCEVCEAVGNGLAVTLGVVRAEVDVDFGKRLA